MLVYQSSPDLIFRRTGMKSLWIDYSFPIWDISIRSGDIRDRNLKLSEIAPNFARFGPQFHGDRPSKLGDLAVKKRKETLAVKHKIFLC